MALKAVVLNLAHNVVYFAKLLKDNPIPTNLKQLIAEAQEASQDVCPPRHGGGA
ncbi:MAG: hypothetical protein ACE5NW_05350 [Acidiferrobacterales bacterium]